jgi:hypothetical protein
LRENVNCPEGLPKKGIKYCMTELLSTLGGAYRLFENSSTARIKGTGLVSTLNPM